MFGPGDVLADDDSASPQIREGKKLLADAQKLLAAEEAGQGATKADQAAKLFQDAGSKPAAAEALRLLVDAWRQESSLAGEPKPQKAMDFVEEQATKFQAAGDKHSEACMYLSKAEIYTADIKGSKALDTAYQAAETAKSLFKDIQATSMQAYAMLAIAKIHFLRGRSNDVRDSASAALTAFQGSGNKLGEASALHALALSYIDAEDYAMAQKKAREALQIYRALGDKDKEAFELLVCALLSLEGDQASKAQPLAQDALNIMRMRRGEGSSGGLSRDAFALHIIIESLCRRNQDKKAVKAAKEAEEHFTKIGGEKALAYGGEVMLHTYTKLDKAEEAISAGDKALTLVQRMGSKKMELNLLYYMMRAHVQAGSIGDAVQCMEDAASAAQSLGDASEEAYARHEMAKLHLTPSQGRVETKNIDRAISAANEARALFRGLDLKDEEAAAIMTAATGHFMSGDADRARSEAMEAQELFQEEGYHKGADYAMSLIIDCHGADDEFGLAIEMAEKRRDMWKDFGNKKMEAQAACSLANVLYSNEDYEEAARVAASAKGLYDKCSDVRGKVISSIIQTQANVALLMQEEGDPSKPSRAFTEAKNKSLSAAAEAVAYAGKAGDKALRATAIMWRARALMWSFRHDDARRAAEEAKKIYTDLGDVEGQAQALLIIANSFNLTKQTDKSTEVANECMELAQSADDYVTAEAAKELIDVLTAKPVVQMQSVAEAGGDAKPIAAGAASGPAVAEKKGLDLELTTKKVFEIVKNVMATDDELEADSPLMEAGMDSLSSVQMVSELAREFQMQMAPSLVFDFPTINALAADIVQTSLG